MNEGGDDRGHQDRLGEHHCARREQQAQFAQRTRARQEQVERQTDHNGRQAEQGIDDDDQQAPTGETENRQAGAERQPEQDRESGRQADAEGKRDDAANRADPTVVQKSAISPLGSASMGCTQTASDLATIDRPRATKTCVERHRDRL